MGPGAARPRRERPRGPRLEAAIGLFILGFGGLLLFAADRLSDVVVTIGLFSAAITTWIILSAVERIVARRHPAHHGA